MANDLNCERIVAALSMLAGGAAIRAIERIARLHGCDSTHAESVPAQEVFMGHSPRDGVLEIFDLIGHPKAKRSHEWTYGGVSYQINKARGRLIGWANQGSTTRSASCRVAPPNLRQPLTLQNTTLFGTVRFR